MRAEAFYPGICLGIEFLEMKPAMHGTNVHPYAVSRSSPHQVNIVFDAETPTSPVREVPPFLPYPCLSCMQVAEFHVEHGEPKETPEGSSDEAEVFVILVLLSSSWKASTRNAKFKITSCSSSIRAVVVVEAVQEGLGLGSVARLRLWTFDGSANVFRCGLRSFGSSQFQ